MTSVYGIELELEFGKGKKKDYLTEFYNVVADNAEAAIEVSKQHALEDKTFTKASLNGVKHILTIDILSVG